MVSSTLQKALMNDLKSVFYSCSEKIWNADDDDGQ